MKKFMKKMLIGLALSTCIVTTPLTSCSMFGEDGFTITDIDNVYDPDTNEVIVTIYTTSEETPIFTFRIPAGLAGINGVSIVDVKGIPSDDGMSVTLVVYYSDNAFPPTEITVPIIKGKDGRGIDYLDIQQDSSGNLYITVIYDDGTSEGPLFLPRGVDGNGIKNVEVDDKSDPLNVIVTIHYTDESLTPTVVKIPKGIGVQSITYDEKTSDDDNYSLKIVYSDGYTTYITIPRPKTNVWHVGESAPDKSIGKDGDFYLNQVNGFVYQKRNGSWEFLLSMKGTGSAVNFLVKFYPSEGVWSDGSNDTIAMVVNYGEYIDLKKIPTPYRDNYVFNGWWTTNDNNPNAGHFTDLTPVLKDMNLYPRWIEE